MRLQQHLSQKELKETLESLVKELGTLTTNERKESGDCICKRLYNQNDNKYLSTVELLNGDIFAISYNDFTNNISLNYRELN